MGPRPDVPPPDSIDWLWFVPDGKAPDIPKPEGSDYHTYFKCKPCDVSFRAWKVIGQQMTCYWCELPISEFDA